MTDDLEPSRQDDPKANPDALTARVVFRVTQSERDELEAAAADAEQSVSQYARSRLVHRAVPGQSVTPRQRGRDLDQQAVAALNRAGVSLVQMAQRLSASKMTVPESLDDAIFEVRDAIKMLTARR